MNIIQKQPEENGAYSAIHSRDIPIHPEGFYQVADGVTLSCGGFGALIFTNGVVTGFTGDETAWDAWKTANPEPAPQPTVEEKLAELKTENATLSSTIDSIISEILPTLMG